MKFFSSSIALTLSALVASTCQPTVVSAQNVTYGGGAPLYFQNFNIDNTWIMMRDDGQGNQQYGWNLIQRESEIQFGQYAIVSQNVPGPNDPKKGQCVKYGDPFYISNGNNLFWWFDQPTSKIITQGNGHIWTARSNQGNGLVDSTKNQPDPFFGTCIPLDAVVFLQMMEMNGIWAGLADTYLNGGFIQGSPTATYTYQISDPMWIITTTVSDGSTDYALACPAVPQTSTGKWEIVQGQVNANGQTIKVTTGSTSTASSSITNTQTWQASITDETSAGFSFEGISAQTKVTVGFSYSSQQTESISNAVTHSMTYEMDQEFGSGQVWQFKYTTTDACEPTGFDLYVNEFALTERADQYPCCLPGLFLNATNPHGPCVPGSPDACNPSTRTRALRGSQKN
jgi:hypothetical protein